MTETYPEVECLAQAVRQHDLQFSVAAPEKAFASIDYRHVVMRSGHLSWRVPVEDEDGDVESANPVWLLDRVLRECHWFETSEDYLAWAKDLGLKAENVAVRDVYFQLREISPQISTLLGASVRCLPDFDAQGNTALMQALRAWTG